MSLTANDVIEQCRQAYDALSSYQGKTLVCHQVPKSVEQRASEARRRRIRPPSAYMTYRSSAIMWFQRPGRLRVEGFLSKSGRKGEPFTIVSGGGPAWTSWHVSDYTWAMEEDAEQAICGFTGVSGGACTTIPALLLHTDWGDPFRGLTDVSPEVVQDTVRRRKAYRVEARHHDHGNVTFWVDPEQFLLLQIRECTDWNKAMQSVRQKSEELRARGMLVPSGPEEHWEEPYLFDETVTTFTWTALDTPMPEALFARPDGAPSTAERSDPNR